MIERFFHAWERRIAAATTNRVVRPFEWGVDWLDDPGDAAVDPAGRLERAAAAALANPDWFASAPCPGYELEGDRLTFPSQIETPHAANNTVHARYFPAASGDRGRAVLVLPQWNADAEGHVGLCRFLARVGISALRLSLPYHDARMPPELERADYIVSANVGRTLQVNRQAVLDARRAVAWLDARGHDRIGILGSSLGSCLASLTAAHEPRITAAALNHVSAYFADVVWDGLSTAHVRAGLDGAIELDRLRRLWLPISPLPYVDRPARHPGAAGVRALRPDVPGPPVTPVRGRAQAPRPPPPGLRAAVRTLHDRRGAVQVARRLRPDPVPAAQPVEGRPAADQGRPGRESAPRDGADSRGVWPGAERSRTRRLTGQASAPWNGALPAGLVGRRAEPEATIGGLVHRHSQKFGYAVLASR